MNTGKKNCNKCHGRGELTYLTTTEFNKGVTDYNRKVRTCPCVERQLKKAELAESRAPIVFPGEGLVRFGKSG